MSLVWALGAGALAGLASLAHCVAMCGPLAVFASAAGRPGGAIGWQAGRLGSYLVLGVAAGALGGAVARSLESPWIGAVLSWGIAVVLLLTAARLWRGRRAAPDERTAGGPAPIDVGRRPRTPWLVRLLTALPRHSAILGAATALLPCGALAAAAVLAAGSGSALGGAASMLGFAAVSGVGLALAGTIAAQLRAMGRGATRILAMGLLAGALVLAWRPIPALIADAGGAPCPMHAHSP